MRQKRIIGIAGGMGPFAHLDFERKLLLAAQRIIGAARDQDYPEWIVSSVPSTPDRTGHVLGENDDPKPALLRSLKRLEHRSPEAPGANFAVMVCNTAHLFIEELQSSLGIPIVNLIRLVADTIAKARPGATVGVLATTGTLQSGLYADALHAAGLRPVSLLDIPDGPRLQEDMVMAAIYGPRNGAGQREGRSIKGVGYDETFRAMLAGAAARLVAATGAETLIAGCTEIPIVLREGTEAGVPLLDPTAILAEESIRLAYNLPGAYTKVEAHTQRQRSY